VLKGFTCTVMAPASIAMSISYAAAAPAAHLRAYVGLPALSVLDSGCPCRRPAIRASIMRRPPGGHGTIATRDDHAIPRAPSGAHKYSWVGGSISHTGSVGAHVFEGSIARLSGTITGNGGAGVLIHDLSMVTFIGATVTGNGGGTNVVCNPQFPATRGVGSTVGTTNCIEP